MRIKISGFKNAFACTSANCKEFFLIVRCCSFCRCRRSRFSMCISLSLSLSLSLALAHHWNFVDMCKCITFPMYAFGIQLERWRWGAKLGNQIGLNRNDFLIMDFTWLIFIHVHLLLRNLSQLFLSFSFSRCLCLYGSFSFSAFSILLFALYIWQLVFFTGTARHSCKHRYACWKTALSLKHDKWWQIVG